MGPEYAAIFGGMKIMDDPIWLNGTTLPMSLARISPEDRGFQFADGIYEVIRIYDGKLFALDAHMQRLWNSAEGIGLNLPLSPEQLSDEIEQFSSQHAPPSAMIYLQATRGVSPRNHIYGKEDGPTLLFYARELPPPAAPGTGGGIKLFTVEDYRWQRCWIKSIALLPNILAKNAAIAAGADEAVFSDNGIINECSASNILAIIKGRLVTHPVGPKVLPGITRQILLDLARQMGLAVEERPMTEKEAMSADELFITSTTREVAWVSQWNGKAVAGGRCGPITRKLHEALLKRIGEGR